ncbi:MAG: enoyl-CoA hydratase-related protein [Flavisolibacter sp.]
MSPIHFEVNNNIASITFNRPDKFNSFNREMALLFQKHLDECDESETIRCVLITGSGKAFSAGQDLNEVTAENAPDTATILSEHYNPIIKKIRQLSKPVIAAVNGVAAGAGANIALCCDIVIASQSASFIQAFSKIGLIPDSGGTFFLPRLIGWQKASALAMLGDKVPAEEAERIGMVYKIFPDNNFLEEANKIAVTISMMSTKGLALTKQAFNKSFTNNLEEQLKTEEILQIKASKTEDYQKGVAAFLKK